MPQCGAGGWLETSRIWLGRRFQPPGAHNSHNTLRSGSSVLPSVAVSCNFGPIDMFKSLVARSSPAFRLRASPLVATPLKRQHHIMGVHRDTPENSSKDKFTFSGDTMKKVDAAIAKYPENYKKAAIMPLLDLGQRQHGFCSIGVMNEVARILEVPPMRVYEVASFYTMFQREPVGKVHIGVCTNLPCMLRGGYDVYDAAKAFVKDNNSDGFFSLEEVECSGACANGPVAEINNQYFEDLEPNSMVQVLKDCRNGSAKPGPVENKRVSCEPYGAKTSLFGKEAFDVKTVTRTDI